jgi:hypothetical protein
LTVRPIDVAITYASEQEDYVGRVAKDLVQSGINTFYAPFERTELWGEDLIPYLERVFRDLATLCVMFISKEYVRKAWPSLERRSALARQLQDQSVYILPVRFDDAPVPGLSTTIQYLRAGDFTEAQLADAIRQKLKRAKLAG